MSSVVCQLRTDTPACSAVKPVGVLRRTFTGSPGAVCNAKLLILRITERVTKLHLTFIFRPLNLNIATDGPSYFICNSPSLQLNGDNGFPCVHKATFNVTGATRLAN